MSYTALDQDSGEIRLLIFVRTRADSVSVTEPQSLAGDIIQCHLWTFSLNRLIQDDAHKHIASEWMRKDDSYCSAAISPEQQQRYVALSYTWGGAVRTKAIQVNGTTVFVTPNLEAALRALRDQPLMRQGCGVWVDALCIDQSNLLERSEQVVRMRDIYRHAASVVIWIGDEYGDSANAIWLMKLLAATWRTDTHQQLMHEVESGRASIPTGSWAAMTHLMERPFWSRVWVLQEVAMGNRQTPILCGTDTITWGELFDALYSFTSRYIDFVFSGRHGVRGFKRNNIIQLNNQQNQQAIIDGREVSKWLLPILDVARKCLVADDRDRVYGILGMVPQNIVQSISPDYTQTAGEIYTTFAKAVILGRGDLLILEEVTWPPLHGQPSWTPDWRHQEHYRLFSGEPTYNASGDVLPKINISEDSRLLTCTGIHVDRVDGLGATYFEQEPPQTSRSPDDDLQQPHKRSNAYGSDLPAAVWQFLVGDRTPTGKPAPQSYESLLQCALSERPQINASWRGRTAFNRLLEHNRYLRVGNQTLGSFFETTLAPSLDPPPARDALERIFRLWRNRRPFVTERGYLGVGTRATKPGDEVYILFGCTVPVVLRSTGDASAPYQIVGCCYLQGWMQGGVKWEEGREVKIC